MDDEADEDEDENENELEDIQEEIDENESDREELKEDLQLLKTLREQLKTLRVKAAEVTQRIDKDIAQAIAENAETIDEGDEQHLPQPDVEGASGRKAHSGSRSHSKGTHMVFMLAQLLILTQSPRPSQMAKSKRPIPVQSRPKMRLM